MNVRETNWVTMKRIVTSICLNELSVYSAYYYYYYYYQYGTLFLNMLLIWAEQRIFPKCPYSHSTSEYKPRKDNLTYWRIFLTRCSHSNLGYLVEWWQIAVAVGYLTSTALKIWITYRTYISYTFHTYIMLIIYFKDSKYLNLLTNAQARVQEFMLWDTCWYCVKH